MANINTTATMKKTSAMLSGKCKKTQENLKKLMADAGFFGGPESRFGHLQKPWKEKADGAPAPSVCQPISRRIISAASALVVAFCLPFCFSSRAGLPKSGSRFFRAC